MGAGAFGKRKEGGGPLGKGKGGGDRRWPWRYGRSSGYYPAAQPASQWLLWVQGCLAQLIGPWVPQTGVMGPETRQALQTFQAQRQLPTTGLLDNDTVNALQAACGGGA